MIHSLNVVEFDQPTFKSIFSTLGKLKSLNKMILNTFEVGGFKDFNILEFDLATFSPYSFLVKKNHLYLLQYLRSFSLQFL
jgi:hypothetical protein